MNELSCWHRVSVLLGALAVAACARSSSRDADLVLLNAKVITVDSADRIAQAVAIRDGKIVAVGTNAEIEALAGSQTERVDLAGAAVTPGLMDAHMHFANGAVSRMFVMDVSYPTVKTIADIQTELARRVAAAPAGSWVQGRGWDEGKLEERRMLTAKDLDASSAGHPVILTQTTGHYLVANSAALAAAGITRATKDPPGGTIDRFPDGTPTGVLKESAMGLVSRLAPDESPEQVREAMTALAKEMSAEGMTGVKDPGIRPPEWEAYQQLAKEGKLPLRVFALWHGGRSMANAETLIAERAASTRPYESTGDDHVISGGIKLYIDGSGGARTAWLHDDWNRNLVDVDRGNRGYPAFSPDTLRALVKAYHDAGFHVSVHSIGDRGIDWTMDSYAAALGANPQPGRRHGIIHSNIPTDHALDIMADLQHRLDAGYPEPSATFMWYIGDTYAGNFGTARNARLNPFRTFEQRGIRWAGSSDYPVTPFAARYGIWSSVARETMLGVYGKTPFGTAESVDVRTALKSFTTWAARQMFMEKKVGSIEVGKYADLAVWDRDPYTVATGDLKEMRCLMTVFNGRVVFRREGTGTPTS